MDDTSRNLHVIKASAGSGKTYTLAKCYIEQLLFKPGKSGMLERRGVNDYHQHILAITFTNMATNEMKERIVKELYILGRNPEESDYYKNDFKTSCSADALAHLKDDATNALAAILFNYSSFRVSTIDSFFQAILRSFARELDHDYNYELQLDGDYAARVATENFLLTLGNDANRTGDDKSPAEQWVIDYQKRRLDDNANWNSVFRESNSLSSFNKTPSLMEFSKVINQEYVRTRLDDLCKYLSADPENNKKALDHINDFMRVLKEAYKEYNDRYNNTDWYAKVEGIVGVDYDPEKCNGRKFLKTWLTEKKALWTDSIKNSMNKADTLFKKKTQPSSYVIDELNKFIAEYVESYYYAHALKDLVDKLSYVGLLGEISKKLEEYRTESNTLLIADTNELIGKVVAASTDAPFIYERTGTWINHYMLDEFQDTSRLQYNNFLPLLRESLAHAEDNYNLVIGDCKQAIYRFRNADSSIFRDSIDEDFENDIKPHTLSVNWRSLRNIVKFNNAFARHMFTSYSDCAALQRTYTPNNDEDDYVQKVSGKNSGEGSQPGMVRVLLNGEVPAGEKKTHVQSIIAQYLLDLHKRFDWGEIMILVNLNSEGNAIVEAVLDHNKKARAQGKDDEIIPIVSGEMMSLARSSAVRRIVSLLRFIELTVFVDDNEETNQEEACVDDIVANLKKRRLSEQKMYLALSEFVTRCGDGMSPQELGRNLKECFDKVSNDSSLTDSGDVTIAGMLPDHRTEMMSLVNIVDHIIAKYITASGGADETIYLHAFQNKVMEFAQQSSGGTLREFLRYWDLNKGKLTVPNGGGNDAVNVLTVHKSKGLEAKCVVVPYATWVLEKNDSEYWVDGKEWLANGGSELLDKVAPGKWTPDMVPPLMQVGRKSINEMTHFFPEFSNIDTPRSADALIDGINKTYVAFTRPCKELHILSAAKQSPLLSKLKGFVQEYKEENGNGFEHVEPCAYDFGEEYVYGIPYAPHKDKDNKEKDKSNSKPMPQYEVTANKPDVVLPVEDDKMSEIGTKLHLLMSRVTHVGQLDKAIRYCERRGIIDAEGKWSKENIMKMLSPMLDGNSIVSTWFDPANVVLNERPVAMVSHTGERSSRRPDRVIERGNTIVVVDYKFGEVQEPGNIPEGDKDYLAQVNEYVRVVKAINHSKNVTGYLWYVAKGIVHDLEGNEIKLNLEA